MREDPEIKGICIGGTEYKTSLFAGDVLMTMSVPEKSIPKLMSLLELFGTYSGYKLNTNKSQILFLLLFPLRPLMTGIG